jgi:ATP-dependent Lon protease
MTPEESVTTLVAGDDRSMRLSVHRVQQREGHCVYVAAAGDEAIKAFDLRFDEIDLVIVDAMIPTRDGRSVWQHIASLKPEIKAPIVSGYPCLRGVTSFVTKHELPFLAKPFDSGPLRNKVGGLLS